MCTHLTPNAQPNTEIIKKNNTVCSTKITERLTRSKKSINSSSIIKRVPTLCANNIPPTKSNSFPNTITQPQNITPCCDLKYQNHHRNQSKYNRLYSNLRSTNMNNKKIGEFQLSQQVTKTTINIIDNNISHNSKVKRIKTHACSFKKDNKQYYIQHNTSNLIKSIDIINDHRHSY